MTDTITRSWIEEPSPVLRWERRWVTEKGQAELVLQQEFRIRNLGDWKYKREWRDVPVAEGEG
jgi:hypothetical protein